MAPSTVSTRDLPEMPSVLRAIHKYSVAERNDRESQMRLLKLLVLEKNPSGMPKDELDESARRLRNRLIHHYKSHAKLLPGTKVTEEGRKLLKDKEPFDNLFSTGLKLFPRAHLNKLNVHVDWHPDDQDNKEEVGNAATVDEGQRNTFKSSQANRQLPGHDTSCNVESSKKRTAGELHSPADISESGAPRGKRLQLRFDPPSGSIAIAGPDSSAATLRGATGDQVQQDLSNSQGAGAQSLETQVTKQETKLRFNKIPNSQRADSEGGPAKKSTPAAVHGATTPQQLLIAPVQDVIMPHQDWVQAQMQIIEFNIWQAASAYSQEMAKDELAKSKFVGSPEPELEVLYKQVFGTRWQVRLCDTQLGGPRLKQIYVTQALFGAAIYRAIVAKDSPWDVRMQLDTGLEPYRNYFDATLLSIGQDPEHFLKNVACRQASDRDYQKTAIADQARQLAGSTALTLLPHLQQATRHTKATEQLKYKRWISYLEEAFKAAITLEQITISSDLGPFEIRWPRSGERVDSDAHRKAYELDEVKTEGATTTVLHGTLPGVWKKTDDNMLAYCMALVVPAVSKEVGQ
ncbi:hypothetical protein CBER1_03505 [Cercospora berteroae]|uniref:Uncharacterized protein n=1 Tax=Cercospora berteroae TaxID=357750 RepID=A0A2S6CFY1_9PEZI|nr:hypothetical protein CBER1_03505 [Cercospora berteroae]